MPTGCIGPRYVSCVYVMGSQLLLLLKRLAYFRVEFLCIRLSTMIDLVSGAIVGLDTLLAVAGAHR